MYRLLMSCGCRRVVPEYDGARCPNHPEAFPCRRQGLGGGIVVEWDGETWKPSQLTVYGLPPGRSALRHWRRFGFAAGSSRKYWSILPFGPRAHVVHFGRVGAAGQHRWTVHPGTAARDEAVEELVASKRRKGYVKLEGFVQPAGSPVQAPNDLPEHAPGDRPPPTLAELTGFARGVGFAGDEVDLNRLWRWTVMNRHDLATVGAAIRGGSSCAVCGRTVGIMSSRCRCKDGAAPLGAGPAVVPATSDRAAHEPMDEQDEDRRPGRAIAAGRFATLETDDG